MLGERRGEQAESGGGPGADDQPPGAEPVGEGSRGGEDEEPEQAGRAEDEPDDGDRRAEALDPEGPDAQVGPEGALLGRTWPRRRSRPRGPGPRAR